MLSTKLPSSASTRKISRANGRNQSTYRPLGAFPYSFLKCSAYGGEVTTRLIDFSGSSRKNSRESAKYAAPSLVWKYGFRRRSCAGCVSKDSFGWTVPSLFWGRMTFDLDALAINIPIIQRLSNERYQKRIYIVNPFARQTTPNGRMGFAGGSGAHARGFSPSNCTPYQERTIPNLG